MSTVTSPILNVPCCFLNSATRFCSTGIKLAITSFRFFFIFKSKITQSNALENILVGRQVVDLPLMCLHISRRLPTAFERKIKRQLE